MRRTYPSFTMRDAVKNSPVVLCTYDCIHLFASLSKLDALVRLSSWWGEHVFNFLFLLLLVGILKTHCLALLL